MKLRFFILFIFSLSLVCRSSAQVGSFTQSRILFLLDESSSMLEKWSSGQPKHKVANEIIERLMDSINAVNPQVQYSLRVFGNYHTVMEHDCTDTRNEVPFSPDNHTQMAFRLEDMHPLGVTAIAYSLSEAAEHDLVDPEHNAYSIILITDGGESCNGDICGVMEKLIRNKVFFKPYVLSLEDVPQLKTEYACMGNYLTVTKKGDINKAVSTIVEAFRPMLILSKVDFQKIQTIAANAPSALKVSSSTIKAEIPIITEPVKPKHIDTVVAPKPSKIIVGEEPKRPAPVKMDKAPISKTRRMRGAKYTPAPLVVVASIPPAIKIKEEPVVAVRPAPVTIKKGALPKLVAITIAKPALKPLTTVSATPPEIKIVLEAPPRPAGMTMTPVAIPSFKKRKHSHPEFVSITTVAVTAPEINITLPPPPRPAAIKMATVKMPDYKKATVAKPALFAATRIPVSAPTITIKEEIVPRSVFKMESIAITGLKKFKTSAPSTSFKKVKVAAPAIKSDDPEPPPPAPVVVRTPAKLGPKVKPGVFRMHLLYVNTFLDSDLKPIKVPSVLEFKFKEPVAEVPKPKPTPPPAKPKPGKPGKPVVPAPEPKVDALEVVHEDANETTLQVYLTNAKGKYYTITPRMKLLDPATKKEVKHFFRTVDEAGNPDIINDVAVGKYELTVEGRDDLLAHVDIQQNKHNKVYIKVKNFTLFFMYTNAPTRPVKEFTATVIQRNMDNGKVVEQKCTERLEYEPGNYFITINTFPEIVRNADLDDFERGLRIPQPGFATFTTEVGNIPVDLYKELGDKFVKFATVNLNDPRTKPMQIQPGKYQAHYSNGATKYSTSDRVVPFTVISLETTVITLKK